MNTSALRNFAPAVRRQLMEAVTRKLDFALTAQTPDYLTTFAPQVASLRKLAQADRAGLIDRAAYTWFNRFAALRFMDAHGWHPFRARVLTPDSAAETQPELLKLARTGALPEDLARHSDPQRLNDLLDGRIPSADAQGEVYRHLVLAACRFYHALLPDLFEKIDDETELLLPDDLLTEHSVVHGFRTEIRDEDCGDGQRANVEVLGWLYQFYISERKDQVMARKSAVPTEDIPAVTQLFTPHWIVRYLVENSLGRLWLLNRPGSRLREHMPYYIEDAPSEPPPWQGAWWPRIDYREGDYRTWMWLRPNSALQGDYETTLRYAMSIDGYAYGRERWGIETLDGSGEAKVEEIERAFVEGSASFEDLRYALFVIQRGIKWAGGSGPTDELEARFHACYAALCRAWEREWMQHAAQLPDLSVVGVAAGGSEETDFLRITRPEEIKVCDPAVGSGHMLTYAFDLLALIYEEEGYAPSEIPALILRHNLHGLEICPRATQLAQMALVFKARERSRRFFQPEQLVRPAVIELREVRFAENELRDYIRALGLGSLFDQPLLRLLYQFEEAKNFGSLIQPCLDEQAIADVRSAIEGKDLGGQLFLRETHLKVLRALEQAESLSRRYHVVVANPPYMGGGAMNPSLKEFVKKHLTLGKQDLMTCFMQRATTLAIPKGTIAVINLPSWLFLSSFEALRISLIGNQTICSLLHLGRGIFGSDFGTVAFVLQNCAANGRKGTYRRLFDRHVEVDSVDEIEAKFLNPSFGRFVADQKDFRQISGAPIAYWVTPAVRHIFATATPLKDIAKPRQGLATTNNAAFLRMWYEPAVGRIGFGMTSEDEAEQSGQKWFPLQKGGSFRKWYGNNEYVLNYERRGKTICDYIDNTPGARVGSNGRVINRQFYFRDAITWSSLSISALSMRYMNKGFIFETKGSACFCDDKPLLIELLGYANSTLVNQFLQALSPTLDFHEGPIGTLPVAPIRSVAQQNLVSECISIARADWDNFETSWDFRNHPSLRPELKSTTLEASWQNWEAQSTAAIRRMQELETENNRFFITAYGLESELQPEVPEEQITLARADARRDVAAFLSYAVGCMMGRYSLDQPGLILANAGDTLREFLAKVGRPQDQLTFVPDEDGILPVLDAEWFEDDIVARTREFLRATFGEATLRENIRFIETSIGKVLRKYFLNDFYKDHLQTYKKRPIYWLVQSPRKGFSVLIYLHRYNRDTMNLVLNGYLREYQTKLRNRLPHAVQLQTTATTAREKTAARQETDKLTKILHECEEWERQTVLPLAQARVEIDLDDGVKVNYLKLGSVLAPISGLAAQED